MRNLEGEVARVEHVPIVREYMDLFPKEFPGLPPDREVVFSIDLALGTRPISIPPYRMAPAELKRAQGVAT